MTFGDTSSRYIAGEDTSTIHIGEGEDYEEIVVTFNVQRIGSIEIPAIVQGQVIYLPVKDIFDFLKIRNTLSSDYDSLSGFFINAKATYLIDRAHNRITFQDKITNLRRNDLIRTTSNLYLRSDYFGKVFGLDCVFDFRSLSVKLNTKIELPAIREMQQDLMRRNISKLRGERKADTTIKRDFSWLHLGTADWGVINTQEINGKSSSRIGLDLGGIIAGGEASAYLNYNTDQPFSAKQQFFRWKYVNNDNPVVKQVTAGQVYTQAISTILAPVNGIQFTNTPTTYKRSFGTYRLSDKTEPGWMVELYVNGVLVNFVKADASGFFTFEVPLVYGNSSVMLRFYSPFGEERTREQNISIPFNFLPLHQFEYTVTGGIASDYQKSRFGRGNFSYGLSNHVTVGGGVEYLSSAMNGKPIPFVNASFRIGSNLLISGEHVYNVRTKALLSYKLPANLQLDLNYSKYAQAQTSVKFDYMEERKAVLSMPIRGKKFNAFSRFTLDQYKNYKVTRTTAEYLVSGVFAGISSNFTTYAEFNNKIQPLVYSNFSLTYRLPAGIRFTPQAEYEYREKKIGLLRGDLEKSIFHGGYLNFTYQRDLLRNTSYTGVGLRLNFSFAQASFSAGKAGKDVTISQSAAGSLMYDDRVKRLVANNQSNVGKGGIVILPYLDLNCNGKRDANEPKAAGLNIRINGGRIERNNKDTTIRVIGLEAYTNYFIELDNTNFENIAWQLRNKTINVAVDANHFTLIEVAVAVVGEVSGTVYLGDNNGLTGLGRLVVNFYDKNLKLVGKTVTEGDGYFNFLGLAPGTYTAQLDAAQVKKLDMTCAPSNLSFSIKSNRDGDVVEGLKFVLKKNDKEGK